jgi:DNA-binding transcriptional regulator YdaS (Cro superfamily)
MNIQIKKAAEAAGGVVRLSLMLGLSRGAVSQWREIPVRHLANVERITGIPRSELRPDIFGPLEVVPSQREAA